jgi:hypothetical protein
MAGPNGGGNGLGDSRLVIFRVGRPNVEGQQIARHFPLSKEADE